MSMCQMNELPEEVSDLDLCDGVIIASRLHQQNMCCKIAIHGCSLYKLCFLSQLNVVKLGLADYSYTEY